MLMIVIAAINSITIRSGPIFLHICKSWRSSQIGNRMVSPKSYTSDKGGNFLKGIYQFESGVSLESAENAAKKTI